MCWEPLPRAVLAGVVVAAVVRLVQPVQLVGMARRSRPQAIVAWGTFIATLALAPRVEQGVLVGIGLSLGLHLWRELRIDVPRRIDGSILHLEPRGVLWFATAARLERQVLDALAAEPDVDDLRIDLGGCGRVDFTAATVLGRLGDDARSAGMKVAITQIPDNVARHLERFS